MATTADAEEGDTLLLIGEPGTHLGQSRYARELHRIHRGAPPPVDLDAEKRAGELVLDLHRNALVGAAHDLSAGGLAVAIAELCLSSDVGVRCAVRSESPPHAALFGEDQARYVLTVDAADLEAVIERAEAAGVAGRVLGRMGGDRLVIEGLVDLPLDALREAHENWLPAYMAVPASVATAT